VLQVPSVLPPCESHTALGENNTDARWMANERLQ